MLRTFTAEVCALFCCRELRCGTSIRSSAVASTASWVRVVVVPANASRSLVSNDVAAGREGTGDIFMGLLRREHRRTQRDELGKNMIQRELHKWKLVLRDSHHHHHQRRRWSVGTVQPEWPGGLLQDRLLLHASDKTGLRIGVMGLRTGTMDIHHRRHHLLERRH